MAQVPMILKPAAAFLLAVLVAMATAGCGKVTKKDQVKVDRSGLASGSGAAGENGGAWGTGDYGNGGVGGNGSGAWGADGSGRYAEGMGGEDLPEGRPVPELQEVNFDLDSYAISASAALIIDRNAAYLAKDAGLHVVLRGHCDDTGTEEYNMALGQQRAQAVREHLIGKGVSGERLHTMSFGESMPKTDGADEASRSLNRRVEFFVFTVE